MNNENDKNKFRILIIDDVQLNLQLLNKILTLKGHEVKMTDNGNDGLSLALSYLPDVILLDIMMPGMDGYTVCRKLKENAQTREIPVIFITAKMNESDIIMGFEAGAVDYITKPFKQQELLSRVQVHAELHAAKQYISRQNSSLTKQCVIKDKLISILSHDLRNLFTNIAGYTRILKDEDASLSGDVRTGFLNTILTSTNNGYNLLQNLLDWFKTQTDTIKPNPEKIDIKRNIEEIVSLYISHAQKKNIQISCMADDHIYGYTDINMLNTILRNLVSNAVKFTSENGTVKVCVIPGKDSHILIVSDNGKGIKKEDIPKLFLIGSYFSTKGTANEAGSGLGLLLCKEMANLIGGNIEVESTEGQGTEFRFTVPAANGSAVL